MRIDSNRKVPQTNRLWLGVLDMDGRRKDVPENSSCKGAKS